MDNTARTGSFNSGNTNSTEGALNKAVAGVHVAVDKAASVADEALRQAKPTIDRMADSAHQAVNKASSMATPTAEWLRERAEGLKATQTKVIADTREYVKANPIKSVAAVLAVGLLIGRILR